MKPKNILVFLFTLTFSVIANAQQAIRINQLGYLPQSVKNAVFMSKSNTTVDEFVLKKAVIILKLPV